MKCIDCQSSNTRGYAETFRSISIDVRRDRPKKASSYSISIGSKQAYLKASINILGIVTETEIVIYAVRSREGRLQMFLCTSIEIPSLPLVCLTDKYLVFVIERELSICLLEPLVRGSTDGIQKPSKSQCQIASESIISLEAFSIDRGLLLDLSGKLIEFYIEEEMGRYRVFTRRLAWMLPIASFSLIPSIDGSPGKFSI